MLKQALSQKQTQKLTPLQLQTIKMLSLSTIELEKEIKDELIENPALEEGSQDEDKEFDNQEDENIEENNEEFSIEDFIPEYEVDDSPDYKLYTSNTSKDIDFKDIPYSREKTLQDSLIEQLYTKSLSDKEKDIALLIIGNIDDNGYLTRSTEDLVDDIQFSQNIIISIDEVEKVLKDIQDLDQAGVGARNLQESLILQLEKKKNTEIINLAKEIVSNYFEAFSKKQFEKIYEGIDSSEEEIRLAIAAILDLDPKPGSVKDSAKIPYDAIIPDFTVYIDGDNIELSLNSRNIPELKVSKQYVEMLNSPTHKSKNKKVNKETTKFIQEKIDSASFFIDSINLRQKTLITSMKAIISFQREFFLSGDETKLKPMTLDDISKITSYDKTTISRVTNSKYVSTPYGNFALKYFFNYGQQTESGEEISTLIIKKELQDCINNEDKSKPFTDEELKDILQSKGYKTSRRTVNKYREQLKIPIARLRKEF